MRITAALALSLSGCLPGASRPPATAEMLVLSPSVAWAAGMIVPAPHSANCRSDIGRVVRLDPPTLEARVDAGVAAPTGSLITLGEGGDPRPETLRLLAADPVGRRRAAESLARAAVRNRAETVLIHAGGLAPRDRSGLGLWLFELADAARAAGARRVGVIAPAADTGAYPTRALLAHADFVIVVLDPPSPPITPTPPMSLERARRVAGIRASQGGATRVWIALPIGGLLWTRDFAARAIGPREAERLAAEWGEPLVRDASTAALNSRSPRGELWVSDSVTAARLVRELTNSGIRRFAIACDATSRR